MLSVYPRLRARAAAGTALAGAVVAMFAGAPVAQASTADYLIYPTYVAPSGKTYGQHAAAWWKYILTQPEATNPLTDETGEDCDNNQSGSTWYLAGSFPGAGAITRTCTVPFGKSIVIPVANSIAAAFEEDPADQKTEAYVRSVANPPAKASTDLKVSIDGSQVTNVARYYEESPLFSATLPDGNLFGLPAGKLLAPAVDAGYYVALYPQLPGNHTLKVSATTPDGPVDVTYKIKVSLFG